MLTLRSLSHEHRIGRLGIWVAWRKEHKAHMSTTKDSLTREKLYPGLRE